MQIIRNLFSRLGGICLAGVFFITFAQVIQRYVFQLSIPWANDAIQILFTYSVFFGMAVGVFSKSHLNVDVLIQNLSPAGKKKIDILTNLIVLVFLSAVFFYSIKFVMDNMDQYMTYLRAPMSLSYGAITLTVFFMIISIVLDLIKQLKDLGNKEDNDILREGR